MSGYAGPELAVAVSRAGGLGFIGPGAETKDMAGSMEEAASLLRGTQPFARLEDGLSPVGVSFILWKDDLETAISVLKKSKPCAAWLYAPEQRQHVDEWTHGIRTASPQTQIWIQIGTVDEAKGLLSNSIKPDVVVVQGSESGGHGRAKDGMGLMSLLPEVVDVMADTEIPIFAAGGIADARGVAASLCLGASGVVMGTRFLASHEARISPGYQNEIVRAGNGAVSTTRTLLYNHLRGEYGWPEDYVPRTMINKSYVEFNEGRPFEELRELWQQAGDKEGFAWGPEGRRGQYVGASIGLIHEVRDAADIVRDVRDNVVARIKSLQAMRGEE
ncbi:nitronate monooxygenase [Trichoderma asperellum]|uniref:Nitronate monooxygenase n=1 Tax=Trichoderma asperellum TaxID=101201 RepID=A0A6V8QK36_TRIAP|nr:nitronate monooxygenase [Trichoderma asperellum]